MSVEARVAEHYTTGALLDRIRAALAEAGIDPDRAAPDDLKAVDEFHIGGAEATRDLIARVDPGAGARVLDIGSGLGGTARLVATLTGAEVTGIDLTPEFVETAGALSAMVGLGTQTRFVAGSALDLPFEDGAFGLATLLHVGMNIPDKPRLMAEAARVLGPGGVFAVYDVMRTGPGDIAFPVPWAETAETSFLATPEAYRAGAEAAGLTLRAETQKADFALAFFEKVQALTAAGKEPAVGLDLLMPDTRMPKFANMIANIRAGLIAPVEMIFEKPD